MRTVLLASLRTHLRRYVAAVVAVVVSVAFVVVVGVLAAGAQSGVMNGVGSPFREADHVIYGLGTENAIAYVEQHGDAAAATGRAMLPVSAGGEQFPARSVGPIATVPEFRWQRLAAGRFPAGPGEAVVDVWAAQDMGVAVGDRLRIGADDAVADLEVVGVVESPSAMSQAAVYVTFPQLMTWRDDPSLALMMVGVVGEVGPLPDDAFARTPEEAAADTLAAHTNSVNTMAVILLVFAAIALLVSVLVIANTFAILLAQRLRDFALLRCVGATRRQVEGSVRREAAVVGVVASLAGVLAGVGLGYGLIALVGVLDPRTVIGVPGLPVPWLAGGFVVGVVVTVAASWLPTRRVVRVSPLAALRPDAALDLRTAAGRTRRTFAAFALLAGLVLLGTAMAQDSTAMMLAGGGSVFVGVLLFGPVLVPRLVRAAGKLLGPAGRLATENAVRNPRRTATTTASLLVGVTLTTAVLTGLATTSASADANHAGAHPLDVAITSWDRPLTAELLDQVRGTPGVAEAVAVDGVLVQVAGVDEPLLLLAAPHAERVARDGGAFTDVAPETVKLDSDVYGDDPGAELGDPAAVRAGGREVGLRATAGTGWGGAGIVAPETLAALADRPQQHAIWVRASADADPVALVADLDALADPFGAETDNGLQAEAADKQQLAVITWIVLGLLGISVVIALVGVTNTLGLSVLERAREHAMLRALGLTRRQLRRMLASEAMLLSVVAAVLGTVLGVGFAWVGYETFVQQALSQATFALPWPSLGVVLVVAALAGLLAAVLPARQAALVTPAAGLSLD